jgi:hypothetical protein
MYLHLFFSKLLLISRGNVHLINTILLKEKSGLCRTSLTNRVTPRHNLQSNIQLSDHNRNILTTEMLLTSIVPPLRRILNHTLTALRHSNQTNHILYFSISGLLLYRRLTKHLFITLDISSKIFSPTVHLQRQLLRRIWMDTWTCLLLCHPETKLPRPSQKLTSSPHAPRERHASLVDSFKGLGVGERHLENIKKMRWIGYKRFYDSCKELSQEEIMLRQKVYNLYCGPGIPSESL